MDGSWQLQDRPVEQEAIRSALTRPDCRGVLVIGPAGVGKTTLTRAVTESLTAPVHWAACTETSQSIPLGAFAPWVGSTGARDPIALLVSAREAILNSPDVVIG